MPLRQDVWTHDSCLVCQTMHSTEEDKHKHELDASHRKKVAVYDFLFKELSCLTPTNKKSLLYERYYRANACVAGLDCIYELNFSWSTAPLWACTICYTAGETLESADDHMHSSYHKRTYICEYHPDRYAKLLKVQEKSAKSKHSLLEQEAIIDALCETKGLVAPDVYVLNERSREWAFQRLGITTDESRKNSYVAENVTDSHKIVLCYICGETFISFTKETKFQDALYTHLSTNIHQRCKAMHTLVHEDCLAECVGVPAECVLSTNSEFRRSAANNSNAGKEAHYGPTVGLEHLIIYNGNECFCSLCFTVLPISSTTAHFSSEYHIERFFRRDDPGKLLNTQYLSVDERHEILKYCNEEMKPTAHKYFRSATQMPLLLQKYAFPERHSLVKYNLEEVDLGHSIKVTWCEECKEYVNTAGDESAWSIHIFDDSHFERAANKALHHYEATAVTRGCAVLDNFLHSYPPQWDEQFSVSLGVLSIQNHCEFGLEFIVRDVLSGKLCCTCCFVQFDVNDMQICSKHARSLEHITHAMHSLNKKTMVTLNWRFPNMKDRKPLFMDYLVHRRMNLRKQKHGISVYNPALVCKLNCSLALPKRVFELAKIAPNDRISYIKKHREQGTPEMIPLDVVLNEHCKIEVKSENKEVVVCHCEECFQSFSEIFTNLDHAIEEHLLSLSHWERKTILDDNPFDESQRLHDKESKIKLIPFKQLNSKKKVTWKWNDKKACYEFVFAQLGLEDIRERRHFRDGKTDFFCILCAQSFKNASTDLDCHICSFSHLFYFMQRHRPSIIPELQAHIMADVKLVDKHKNIRRLFARTLKGYDTEKKQCGIAIYDFEERECEYLDVKKALEEDHQRETEEEELRNKNNGHQQQNETESSTCEIFNLAVLVNRVQAHCQQQQKWPSGEALDKHLTTLIEGLDTDSERRKGPPIARSLEHAKKQLLNLVYFDGMVQLENANAAGTSASSLPAANDMEKQQKRQTKESAAEKSKAPNVQSSTNGKGADNAPEIATSGRKSTTPVDTPMGIQDASKDTRWSRESGRRRRTRTPSPHQRSRHNSRSHTNNWRYEHRRRAPSNRRCFKNRRSLPSPKRTRRERKEDVMSSRPSSGHSRSKSVTRRPPSRTSTSPPVTYESAKRRLADIKQALCTDTPRQFFPFQPVSIMKQTPGACTSGEETSPPSPKSVPPVASCLKKSVGGAYDAGLFEKACPDLLRKSHAPMSNSDETTRPVAVEKVSMVAATVEKPSLGSLNDNDANRTEESGEQLRDLLMNRLKKEARKEIYKTAQSRIPKGLPAFKQQALLRQQTEELQKSMTSRKKFCARAVGLQEKQTKDRQEEERLQAISPDPDEIVGPHLQQQQRVDADQPNNTTNILSKSIRLGWSSGNPVLAGTPPTSSPFSNTRPLASSELLSSTFARLVPPNQHRVLDTPMSTISSGQQAQNVLKQLATSTSAVRVLSEQHQQPMSIVRAPVRDPSMLQPMDMHVAPVTQTTNLLGPHRMPAPVVPPSIPPTFMDTINSALGVPMQFLPTRFSQPTLMVPFPFPMQQQQPAMMNPADVIMFSKMQLYSRDLVCIDNIAALIEYMWKQGYEPIPPGDPPLLFNQVLSKRKGLIGANTLYHIICFGHSELETYYCGMCNHWTTVSEMFNHLRASMHRLSYMFRNYKMYHRKAMEEQDEERRDELLERFASKIWGIEGCGRCTNRMRCILNEEAIRRIWPDYISCVDNSWKIMDDEDKELGSSTLITLLPTADGPSVGPSGGVEGDRDRRPKTDKWSGPSPSSVRSSLAERLASSAKSVLRSRDQVNELEQEQVRRQLSPERPAVIASGKQQRKQRPIDDQSEMRKAIAVMVELQQEYENNNGYLSAEMFFNTCQEFGIPPDQVVNNRLLCESANELNVDLHAGLQAFIQHTQQPQQKFSLQSMGVDASKLRGLDPRALQSILSKANTGNTMPFSSPAQTLTPSPMRSRFELHEIALDESMAPINYVYPSYEQGIRQQRRQAPVNNDTNISRLTFAFQPGAHERPPATPDSANAKVAGRVVAEVQNSCHPFPTADGQQPNLRGDSRSGWGVPPDPKGAGHVERAEPSTDAEMGYQQQQRQEQKNTMQQQTQPNRPPQQPYSTSKPETPQRQQQALNPDLRRIAEEVGDDWNSLESFSFEMLGFGVGVGQQQRQTSTNAMNSSAAHHPPPPP